MTLPQTFPPTPSAWTLPSRGRVGMLSFIVAEATIFTIFVVAYLFYLGKSLSGPTPREVLELPIFSTICLLSSSFTIHLAVDYLRKGRSAAFNMAWGLTLLLGAIFLTSTGLEWRHLIVEKGLTILTNLFGTTYYSLVGLHASHVTGGLVGLIVVMVLALAGKVRAGHAGPVDVLSLYWHFVDAVWVVVFIVVYVIGR